jgi:hypothetical protein
MPYLFSFSYFGFIFQILELHVQILKYWVQTGSNMSEHLKEVPETGKFERMNFMNAAWNVKPVHGTMVVLLFFMLEHSLSVNRTKLHILNSC